MLLLLPIVGAKASSFQNETLHYVITYKWGLIQKDAGEATLRLRERGSNYDVSLYARTKPWADGIFQVRDTLLSSISKTGFRPGRYTKIAHEGGKYAKDVIDYTYSGNVIGGSCARTRVKDGKTKHSSNSLTATGPTYDMLSVFYYLRTLDFSRLLSGKQVKATVFSGSRAETITIRSTGVETLTLRNKTKRKAYHLKFRFTTHGGKKSSDDMDAWISVDAPHIPLQLEGSLPIGKVKCFYLP